ncbi:putative membrane protein YeaQ/YmgE (transglycosylase-associated protein family) [Phyllobacterium trifolii]|uniref:Putative membrane protein YeaQ/YmgE (Transglycosylase-associated protein family) n=1 Tax=Phyllobacterium trifolii TaxID=300193 RepID=A0A839UAZ4_9HYPH|nr:putative membrane protein YeaQ/YmgE (transglycosylase-associated protein family) [Phyllobacterium trifolii]
MSRNCLARDWEFQRVSRFMAVYGALVQSHLIEAIFERYVGTDTPMLSLFISILGACAVVALGLPKAVASHRFSFLR